MSVVALLLTLPKLTAQERALLLHVATLLSRNEGGDGRYVQLQLSLIVESSGYPKDTAQPAPVRRLAPVLTFPSRPLRPAPPPWSAKAEPRQTSLFPAVADAPPPPLLVMPLASIRPFSGADARHGAAARQRLWIEYDGGTATPTARIIEIYQPDDGALVRGWCVSARAPIALLMAMIRCWRWLPERFECDLAVAAYWRHEGHRPLGARIPWARYLEARAAEEPA